MFKEKIRVQILDGALQAHKNYLIGCYKGYHITVDVISPHYFVTINAHSAADTDNVLLQTFLNQHKNSVKQIQTTEARPNSILLTLTMPNLMRNLPSHLNDSILPIIQYLTMNNYASGCSSCGDSFNQLHCYNVNGIHQYICDACAQTIESELQQNKAAVKMQKSQFVPGLIGAFLGALIGAALWIIIYRLGYIAGIAGAVTAVCALKGYEFFGKHLDKKGVICSVLIMIVVIYFANRISWAWEAYYALKEYDYTFSDCYRYLNEIISDSQLTSAYLSDLGIGYFLTFLCSIKNIINAFKSSTGSYTMKKM